MKSETNPGPAELVSKQTASVLTIIGGAFYLIGALAGIFPTSIFVGLFGSACATPKNPPTGCVAPDPVIFVAIFGFGAIAGVLIIAGGVLINSTKAPTRKTGGTIALVMIVLGAIPTLGGFHVGFLLALIGSILGLTYREGPTPVVLGYQPVTQYSPHSQQEGTGQTAARRLT